MMLALAAPWLLTEALLTEAMAAMPNVAVCPNGTLALAGAISQNRFQVYKQDAAGRWYLETEEDGRIRRHFTQPPKCVTDPERASQPETPG